MMSGSGNKIKKAANLQAFLNMGRRLPDLGG
jgi:hypothetical protein